MTTQEGWGHYGKSNKYHYFKDGKRLCDQNPYHGKRELEPDDGKPDPCDCVICRSKLEEMNK